MQTQMVILGIPDMRVRHRKPAGLPPWWRRGRNLDGTIGGWGPEFMTNQRAVPYHLLAKPAGAACNLGCKYCFFLSKENLYPTRESPLMSDALLEPYIRN